jgi:GNAT superfamily N-acetyltransferase
MPVRKWGAAMKIVVEKILLPVQGIDALAREAEAEGYHFIPQTLNEWESGKNRFSGEGEALLGVYAQVGERAQLVGMGGLTVDPFAGDPGVGRLRRIYVRTKWRRQGIGETLVTELLRLAAEHFERVRLRAVNAGAAQLYERFGFVPIDDGEATHLFELRKAVG